MAINYDKMAEGVVAAAKGFVERMTAAIASATTSSNTA